MMLQDTIIFAQWGTRKKLNSNEMRVIVNIKENKVLEVKTLDGKKEFTIVDELDPFFQKVKIISDL